MILLRLEEKQYVIFRSLDHLREMFEPLTITTKKKFKPNKVNQL